MKDAQESELAEGAAQGELPAAKKPRGAPLHWSRSFVVSWTFHGLLIAVICSYIAMTRIPPKLGERGVAIIEIAHEPDPLPPLEEPPQEPPPEVKEPEVQHKPELIEPPREVPEFLPEVITAPEPLDWLPPQDLFADATPFKKKQEPAPEPTPAQPVPLPEPAPLEPSEPIVPEGEELPKVLEEETPAYPRQAKRLRWEGTVILRIRVDAAGKVIDVIVHESSGYSALDDSAVAAFQNWLFEPRGANDPAIRVLRKPFTFRLQ